MALKHEIKLGIKHVNKRNCAENDLTALDPFLPFEWTDTVYVHI